MMRLRVSSFGILFLVVWLVACGGAAAPAPASKPAEPAKAAEPAKPAAEAPKPAAQSTAAAAAPAPTGQSGAAGAAPAAKPSGDFKPDVSFIRIASGSGGTWPPTAAKLAELIGKHVPGVQGRAVPGSPDQHMVGLQTKQYEMALIYGDIADDAFQAKRKPFDKPHDQIRHLASLHPGALSILVRADSPFRTLEDLAKHPIKLSVLDKGSAQYFTGKIVFQTVGVDIDRLSARGGVLNSGVNYDNQIQSIQDGHTNVAVYHGGIPFPTITQIEQTTEVRFIPLTAAAITALKSGLAGYTDVTLPKSTYKALTGDYPTVGTTAQFSVRADLSDELVYRITAAWWDNLADAQSVGVWGKDFKLESAMAGVTIPTHPGAARYYNEKGVKPKN
ncbi:MAG: TAXI family TRAP transporter solute-binding subunit [Chloroflexi bacterium]|nr:TAXI family TRAP transporter solute-binding subunit [Chloroflexota bacterium]